jgi:putative FmdB family regulatory protein
MRRFDNRPCARHTMPIYEYQCASCGHTLEKLQKISDTPLRTCPACGADALNKLVSAAGFRLKGGGWYETDFKSGSRKNVAQGESGAGKDGGKDSGKEAGKSAGKDSGTAATTVPGKTSTAKK